MIARRVAESIPDTHQAHVCMHPHGAAGLPMPGQYPPVRYLAPPETLPVLPRQRTRAAAGDVRIVRAKCYPISVTRHRRYNASEGQVGMRKKRAGVLPSASKLSSVLA
jgi:hypothetical protein